MVLLRSGCWSPHPSCTWPLTCSPVAPQARPVATCTLARRSVLAPDVLRGEEGALEAGAWLLGERGGRLGVLCKRPSGSVRFRAVTPLPVSPRPTVTTVAAALCGRQDGSLVLGTTPAELQGCGRKALQGSRSRSRSPSPEAARKMSDVQLSVRHTWPAGALLSISPQSRPLSICSVAGALGPWDSSVSKRQSPGQVETTYGEGVTVGDVLHGVLAAPSKVAESSHPPSGELVFATRGQTSS